jgi:hypothetical protein
LIQVPGLFDDLFPSKGQCPANRRKGATVDLIAELIKQAIVGLDYSFGVSQLGNPLRRIAKPGVFKLISLFELRSYESQHAGIFLQCFRTSWMASLRFNLGLSISLIAWAISSLTIRLIPLPPIRPPASQMTWIKAPFR